MYACRVEVTAIQPAHDQKHRSDYLSSRMRVPSCSDHTRIVYLSYLAECILELPPQSVLLPVDELNTTVCDVCTTDFLSVCAAAAGSTMCSVECVYLYFYFRAAFSSLVNTHNVTKNYR